MIDTVQRSITPRSVCLAQRATGAVSLLFDGGSARDAWSPGPLVALSARVADRVDASGAAADVDAALERVDRSWRARQARGAGCGTGIALLLAYDALDPWVAARRDLLGVPRLVAIEVDESVRWVAPDRVERSAIGAAVGGRRFDPLLAVHAGEPQGGSARAIGRPRTSLPRPRYLAAVERVLGHIRDGDVYQANLCRVWHGSYAGDELEAFDRLARVTPAPRAAFLATEDLALASASPETFLRIEPPDRIETWPIKGTRPRGATPRADRRAAEDLRASEKDRAELLMIVDLERNDLGRVCRTGTIEVPVPGELRSFPAVHHRVACIRGRLREDATLGDIVHATFPGGSITGAPKERAREILADLEPLGRGFFTGSLMWLGDDGTLDSSILIRTLVFREGLFHLGAGGGIVAESVADDEWRESAHKARALADVLGFDPEDAG